MAVLTKITSRSLADNAVTSAHVQGDVIAAGDIAAGAIGSSELATDAVIAAKIATGAVVADGIGAGAVVAAGLGSNAVTQVKVADDAIGAAELASDAVVNASVAAGAAIAVGKLAGTANKALETSGTGAVQVSATTTTELAKIAGLTSSTAELNKLDGVTATPAELNILDGSVSGPLQHRNMIINGAMQVWQRATATTTVAFTYGTADRWGHYYSINGAWTSERYSMTLPDLNTTGQSYALKLACTGTDTSVGAGQYGFMRYKIEGQDCTRLQYGTAAAKTMTLSFWVKSNKAGIYCVGIVKPDSTQYSCPVEYTINSANTWEKKTITITPTAGSTSLITGAAGIINNDNGTGLEITFTLVMGTDRHGTNNTWVAGEKLSTSNQVNWFDSTSNNFYLTGVQFELGSSATPFEHRPLADELAKCYRYCFRMGRGSADRSIGRMSGTSNAHMAFELPVSMRAIPTASTLTGDAWSTRIYNGIPSSATSRDTGNEAIGSITLDSQPYSTCIQFIAGGGSGMTDNRLVAGRVLSSDIVFSAEL